MTSKKFFWLHIKKSAGISTRHLLAPHYKQVDRTNHPPCFIQSSSEYFNDILNNYRIPLGNYQFKRALFAKKYLYPDTWDELVSFVFCRDPQDRCISMFYYLFWRNPQHWEKKSYLKSILTKLNSSISSRKLLFSRSYAFDAFLDLVAQARSSTSIYKPLSLSFTTHTNPMWNDITDLDGNIIIKHIFRLDDLSQGLSTVFKQCMLPVPKHLTSDVKKNISMGRQVIHLTQQQTTKINNIYSKDFEIYHSLTKL